MLDYLLALQVHPRLLAWQARSRAGAAWVAFAVETIALAGFWFGVLTFFICRASPLLTVREWGRFLTRYELASAAQRAPVNLVLAIGLLALTAFILAVRWPGRPRNRAGEPTASAHPTHARLQKVSP